jgi:hypothetical protein
METYSDIAPANDLDRIPLIDIQTIKGKIQFIPMLVTRGSGTKKWCVTILGFCAQEVPPMTECRVFFKGQEIGGRFSEMQSTGDGLWRARFEAVIPVPEFWQDGISLR